jgi:hypothetical protein
MNQTSFLALNIANTDKHSTHILLNKNVSIPLTVEKHLSCSVVVIGVV